MKTVGEIIHSERLKKDLSLERLSQLTKIDIKYLEAIEKNHFQNLPSETFIKGFIRNISLRLDKNPDELVAIFRRDYKQDIKKTDLKNNSPKRGKLSLEPTRYLPYVFGALLFLAYLGFQFRAVLTPPKLDILKPVANSVVVSPFEVEGDTSVFTQISLGQDTKASPDENGHFISKLSMPIGETILEVKATNRFGRTTTKKISFTIISK